MSSILSKLTSESIGTVGGFSTLPHIAEANESLSATFRDLEIPATVASDVISGRLSQESIAVSSTVIDSLEPVVGSLVTTLCGENLSQHDIDVATEAGIVGALMAADVPVNIKHNIQETLSSEGLKSVGFNPDSITVKDLAKECFKNSIEENLQEHTCRFNLLAVGPNEFVKTVAPLILFKPNENGLRCSLELIYIQDDITHKVSGDIVDFNRRSLINAITDPSILGDRTRALTPIVRTGGTDDSTDKFIDPSQIAYWNKTIDGDVHQTGVLQTSVDANLIGISQSNSQVAQGGANTSDILSEVAAIKELYVRISANRWIKVDASAYSSANFRKSAYGEATAMSANFKATLVLTGDSLFVNATTLKSFIPELDPAANGGFEYKVFMKVGATGDSDIKSGTTTVVGTYWNVISIYDQNDNLIDLTAGDGAAIKLALEGSNSSVAKCRIRGWYPDFQMANLNHKRRGDLIGKVIYTEEMWIPYMEPISCPREVGASRDPAEVDTLVRITHAAMDNATVELLLNSAAQIKQWVDTSVPGMLPDSLGIARYIIKPTIIETALDVAAVILGISSADRYNDITAVIVNALRTAVYRMWSESGMDAAKTGMGVSGRKERIVIAADPIFSQYLYTIGDLRLLGDQFDVKIVFTSNVRMKGKIFAFPSNPVVDNQCDCLRFAHTGYAPEVITNLDLPINGGVENVLTVYPRWKQYMTLPVMSVIEVSNVDAAYGP